MTYRKAAVALILRREEPHAAPQPDVHEDRSFRPTARLVRRQCNIPLSRPILRRPAFPGGRRPWRRLDANRVRCGHLCAVDQTMEDYQGGRPANAIFAHRPRRLSRDNEHVVLSGARSAANEPGCGNGVRWDDRRCVVRTPNGSQFYGARACRAWRVSPDRREMVNRPARAFLGVSEWRTVRRLYRAGT